MAYTPGILLGQITKTSGFEGGVIVKLGKKFIENIPEMESVFIETDGRLVPFFLSTSEYNGSDILKLSFNGYGSQEKVTEFKGCRIFLTTGSPENEQESEYQLLAGYSVLSYHGETVGKIREVISNPGQLLLNILSPTGKEILIPLHEDLIISVDKMKRSIVMEIPEGLIDIN
jgi:16S rRNA processing protein RimM